MHRSACYGSCPVYTISVHDDGTLDWNGEAHVKIVGPAHGTLTAAQVDELRKAFADARFDGLSDFTRSGDPDSSSVVLTFRYAWGTKRVAHYEGDDHAPRSLEALEESFDRIAGTERWAGTAREQEQWID
jgi:hypothetical protein